MDEINWHWVSPWARVEARERTGGSSRARRWRRGQASLLTGFAVVLLAATVSSIVTSGAATVATSTSLVDPAANYDGPVSSVTYVSNHLAATLLNHAVCSSYASGEICATVTAFAYRPETCHPGSCTPTRSSATYRPMWAVPDLVRVEFTDSGDRPFVVSLAASNTLLIYGAQFPPVSDGQGLGATSELLTQPVLSVANATTSQCGRAESSWVTVPATGSLGVCLSFLLPQWGNDGVPDSGPSTMVARPVWKSLEIGGIALWEEPVGEGYGGGVIDADPSLDRELGGSAFMGDVAFDVTEPEEFDLSSYGYQQVWGSPSGHIEIGSTAPADVPPPGVGVAHRGVVLLMVRQWNARGHPEPTAVTDAYVDVATACTATGCTISRMLPDSGFDASRVAACRGVDGFTCVPFYFPAFGRIVDGGYNVSLWGPRYRGAESGVMYGYPCSGDQCEG